MGAFSNCKATLDYSQWNCDFVILISENEDFSWSVMQHSLLFCSITLTQFFYSSCWRLSLFYMMPMWYTVIWSQKTSYWQGMTSVARWLSLFSRAYYNSPECPQHVGFKLWVSTFAFYFTISNSLVYEKWGCQPVVSWVLRVLAGNLWISLWINCQIGCTPRILNLPGWQVETATEKSAILLLLPHL